MFTIMSKRWANLPPAASSPSSSLSKQSIQLFKFAYPALTLRSPPDARQQCYVSLSQSSCCVASTTIVQMRLRLVNELQSLDRRMWTCDLQWARTRRSRSRYRPTLYRLDEWLIKLLAFADFEFAEWRAQR